MCGDAKKDEVLIPAYESLTPLVAVMQSTAS